MSAVAVPAPRHVRVSSRALTVTTHTLGAAAFLYPFFLPGAQGGGSAAHGTVAPMLFAAFSALLIAIAALEVRAGSVGAKEIALLGVLSGINATLRLPGSFGGASLMFLLPVLCGYALGARFGFLLGASSMAASALITGGIGPWLPFQMWALGWVGGGAAMLRRAFVPARSRGGAVVALAVYAWAAGYAFGALTNLWFWPFTSGSGPLGWQPGMDPGTAFEHYRRFYLATSLAWDSSRALANAALVLALGRPVLRLLARAGDRLHVRWSTEPAPARRDSIDA